MPSMNYVAIAQNGDLHWNGEPTSSGRPTEYLRQSHQLNPEPVVFLRTEMRVSCEALVTVRKQMDEGTRMQEVGTVRGRNRDCLARVA